MRVTESPSLSIMSSGTGILVLAPANTRAINGRATGGEFPSGPCTEISTWAESKFPWLSRRV